MRVLVTGADGFVGSYFYGYFATQRKVEVLGIDAANPIEPVDARDFFRTSSIRFDLVIHCAAVVGGRRMIERRPLDLGIDLSIDAELFQWALRTQPERLVYFSSSAVYPTWMQAGWLKPLRENDVSFGQQIGAPDMTYGWAKLTGEYQCGFLAAEGVRVYILRPFSGYGPGQSLDYPFPSFVRRAAEHQDPFVVWGDGSQQRDFIHIGDIVRGTLAVLEKDVVGPLNLGTGIATSFNDLAGMVCQQAGYTPELDHLLSEPVGVHCRVASVERLSTVYEPEVSLEEGIAEALREYRYR